MREDISVECVYKRVRTIIPRVKKEREKRIDNFLDRFFPTV